MPQTLTLGVSQSRTLSTLAKYYVLPEDFCYKLPTGMSLEEGALIEPLAVAVHIARQAKVRHGDRVVVFGAGPVGLLVCAVVRQLGAAKVIAVDIQKQRLEFASGFAATATFESRRVSAEENARNLIEENDLGKGADVAIDASGAEPAVQTAIHVLKTGGTYVQGGMGKENMNFPIMACCTKELTVKGSFRYGSGDYKLAVELVAAGKVDVKRLITRKVRFEDAEQAFMDVKAATGIKVLIGGSGDEGSEVGESDGVLTVESNGVMGTQHTEVTMDREKDIQGSATKTDEVTTAQHSDMKTDATDEAQGSEMKTDEISGAQERENERKSNGLPASERSEAKPTKNDRSSVSQDINEMKAPDGDELEMAVKSEKSTAAEGDSSKAAAADSDALTTASAKAGGSVNGLPLSDPEPVQKEKPEPEQEPQLEPEADHHQAPL